MNQAADHRFQMIAEFPDSRIVELHALVQKQWWGGKRTLEDVRVMVANTSLIFGVVDTEHDRLAGSARVLTDFAFRATIYDVMVDEKYQGQGLGKRLMQTICDHPKMKTVSCTYLACDTDLFPFYSKWNFKPYDERANWMIRIQREE